jgi:hypothetical protein
LLGQSIVPAALLEHAPPKRGRGRSAAASSNIFATVRSPYRTSSCSIRYGLNLSWSAQVTSTTTGPMAGSGP